MQRWKVSRVIAWISLADVLLYAFLGEWMVSVAFLSASIGWASASIEERKNSVG